MKRLAHLSLLSTGLVLALFACRGGGNGDDTPGDDTPMPDAPPGGSVKVKDVQNDAMAKGTAVELRGVVVTAIDTYGDRTGDFFVQDAEGGAFSGIKVFGAPVDQVAALQVGDVVDITNAEKEEFALTADTSGRTVTELKSPEGGMMTVTKKGTGTAPAPEVVDAKMIAALDKTAREAEWEKWEGVLIKVVNARQLAEPRTFDNMPPISPDSYEFRITGIARVQSALAELNQDAAFGVCYDSIIGVGDYFFSDLVHPRATTDIVSGGTACNPMPTTVAEVQTMAGAELADLTNVVITALDNVGTSKGFWVADNMQAAVNTGVLVFLGTTAIPADYTVGATVNIQGAVTEFDLGSMGNPPVGNTLTEIDSLATPLPAATGNVGAPLPLAASVTDVNHIDNSEQYEGVLVRLTGVKITNAALGQGKVELSDNAANKVTMDDDAFLYGTQTMNTCFATLTGVMSVNVFDDVRTINPRNAQDMVVDATAAACN